jgi:hypothetical protein
VSFKNLKVGPARVEYRADGHTTAVKENYILRDGSDLSASLNPFWLPTGLVLLVPAILVLALRAGMEWRGRRTSQTPQSDPNPKLILACLGSWGIVFFVLWIMPGGDENVSFFNPRLSFSLSIPAFGFIGALVFVIDLFQTGRQNAVGAKEKEFALRLVLGPYAAIVMVLLLKDTFKLTESLDKLETQAALAFFSGFLVVLVLQGLTEKGNEVLGRWRAASRYEPSEIAVKFKLDLEEDLKLRKANLKYLAQLRTIPAADLQALAKTTELSEGLLISMQRTLRLEHLQGALGQETWEKLYQEGVRTVWDVALLTPERIQEIANKVPLSPAVLQKLYDDCQTFVKEA